MHIFAIDEVTDGGPAVKPDFVMFFEGAANAVGFGLLGWAIFGTGLYEALKSF